MKPMVLQIVFYGPDGANGWDIPQLQTFVVFADDEFQALDRILPNFLKEYDMPNAILRGGEAGEAVAYGAAPDGSAYTAEAFDSARQPRLFVEVMKEMQNTIDAPFEDSFISWALAYPYESSRFLEALDDGVGDVFVNDIAAIVAMRPIVVAWRERTLLADLTLPGHRHGLSKSL